MVPLLAYLFESLLINILDNACIRLGVYINFKGTFGVQAQTMRPKFDMMAQQLRRICMSSTLARKYYFTM